MQKHAREKAFFDHDDVATWHTPRDMLQSTVEVCFVLELQITKWMPKNWAEFCLGGPSSLDRITCCQSLSPFTGIELEWNWNVAGFMLEKNWKPGNCMEVEEILMESHGKVLGTIDKLNQIN